MYKQNSRLDVLRCRLTYCGYRIKRATSKLRARLFALSARPSLMRGGYKLKRHDGVIYRIENPRMKLVAEACNRPEGKKCFCGDKPRHVVVLKLAGISVFAIYRSTASFSWLNFVLNSNSALYTVFPLANAIMFDGRIYPAFSNGGFSIFEAVRRGLNPNIAKLL